MSRRVRRTKDGVRHAVVLRDGVEGFVVRGTTHCSGCTELGDYGGGSEYYDFDMKAQCLVGTGCDECGYTGKRRQTYWAPFAVFE